MHVVTATFGNVNVTLPIAFAAPLAIPAPAPLSLRTTFSFGLNPEPLTVSGFSLHHVQRRLRLACDVRLCAAREDATHRTTSPMRRRGRRLLGRRAFSARTLSSSATSPT